MLEPTSFPEDQRQNVTSSVNEPIYRWKGRCVQKKIIIDDGYYFQLINPNALYKKAASLAKSDDFNEAKNGERLLAKAVVYKTIHPKSFLDKLLQAFCSFFHLKTNRNFEEVEHAPETRKQLATIEAFLEKNNDLYLHVEIILLAVTGHTLSKNEQNIYRNTLKKQPLSEKQKKSLSTLLKTLNMEHSPRIPDFLLGKEASLPPKT